MKIYEFSKLLGLSVSSCSASNNGIACCLLESFEFWFWLMLDWLLLLRLLAKTNKFDGDVIEPDGVVGAERDNHERDLFVRSKFVDDDGGGPIGKYDLPRILLVLLRL